MLIVSAVIALAVAVAIGFAWGKRQGSGVARGESFAPDHDAHVPAETEPVAREVPAVHQAAASDRSVALLPVDTPSPPPISDTADLLDAERARLIRSYEAESATVRQKLLGERARRVQLEDLAADRHHLLAATADARAETARYRQLVIDVENDAPPPLLGGRGTPDDLKLIVGIGPMLERMLHQLGINSYRQIARWTEMDIDAFDARLAEFPGRIRRDGWVTQARALHQSLHRETS
ncbi:MAG: hypothetical protein M3Z31_11050 [Pseudomonadota bacterium]|nr:hypothetical protein [Pseudomonadota bacterium]